MGVGGVMTMLVCHLTRKYRMLLKMLERAVRYDPESINKQKETSHFTYE